MSVCVCVCARVFVYHGPLLAYTPLPHFFCLRYLLKLLKHYIFHPVTDEGKAWSDIPHVVQCLNKVSALTILGRNYSHACCLPSAPTSPVSARAHFLLPPPPPSSPPGPSPPPPAPAPPPPPGSLH